ncbi:MAG: GIY-YIG nuclease family protein [Candidatus Omnitrophota bacterium]
MNKFKRRGRHFVYIAECVDGTYYTGYTLDLERRLKMHNAGRGAKYTRDRRPVALIWHKEYRNFRPALLAEKRIKGLTRIKKEELINGRRHVMKPKMRKSWQEKMADKKGLPKVVKITGKLSKRWGKGTLAIPAPKEIDQIMKKVPKGKLITINLIRQRVAKKHKATIGCPMTTGIFSWMAANAAEEMRSQGRRAITPYWRTLKTGGAVNRKYPGGPDRMRRLLEKEGHKIISKGKNYIVADYEKKLVKA